MIDFSIRISNPFANGSQKFLFFKSGKITKNKSWEFQFDRYPRTLFSIGFSLTFRESHSGVSIDFGLFGYLFMFQFYDSRHWDCVNNCWEENQE